MSDEDMPKPIVPRLLQPGEKPNPGDLVITATVEGAQVSVRGNEPPLVRLALRQIIRAQANADDAFTRMNDERDQFRLANIRRTKIETLLWVYDSAPDEATKEHVLDLLEKVVR